MDLLGGDCNTSANRECGKAKLSSIEGAWEEMLLLPPPILVPMWSQMEDSGDCHGYILTKKNVANWRVAKRGSLQLDKERCKEGKPTKERTFPYSFTSVKRTQRIGAGVVRLSNSTERSAEKKERKRSKHVRPEFRPGLCCLEHTGGMSVFFFQHVTRICL